MPKLIIYSGTPQAREFELKPGTNCVGRGDGNDVQIVEPTVSTNHAQILVDGTSVVIKDLNSTNGTFINHKQVTDGVLQNGLTLKLGGLEVVFVADPPTTIPFQAAPPPKPVVPPVVSAPPPDPAAPPPAPVPLPKPVVVEPAPAPSVAKPIPPPPAPVVVAAPSPIVVPPAPTPVVPPPAPIIAKPAPIVIASAPVPVTPPPAPAPTPLPPAPIVIAPGIAAAPTPVVAKSEPIVVAPTPAPKPVAAPTPVVSSPKPAPVDPKSIPVRISVNPVPAPAPVAPPPPKPVAPAPAPIAVAPPTPPPAVVAPVVPPASTTPPGVIRIDISKPAVAPAQASHALRFADSASTPTAAQLETEPSVAIAPATTAPAEKVYAEPPPGKTACKFHPKIGGQWLCRKCEELFCPLCVTAKPSPAGAIHTCRKCGTVCVPVKTRAVASKEKAVVVYSDKMLLIRSLGFGFAAALIGALLWTGLSYLFGVDVPFLFAPAVGALCGYAVKLGSQDTPSPVFSSISVVCCIIGSVLGKLGMIAVTHLTLNTNTTYALAGLGLLLAIFAAWKIGGSD